MNPLPPNLLIVDDDKTIQRLLAIAARDRGYTPISAHSGAEALLLLNPDIQAIVLDLALPGIDGLETLHRIHQKSPGIPVIMLTGTNDAETAVKALKAGATDYLTKPFEIQRLFDIIHHTSAANPNTPTPRPSSTKPLLESSSPRMRQFYRQVEKAASLNSTILITGESGSGKTHLARHIHLLSSRASAEFISVNLPALPKNLIEAELFGHEKETTTTPQKNTPHPGRFQQAKTGTIFLDEIGDLPPELQPKLLNILQNQEFFPLGGKKPIKTHSRVIAATHTDLLAKVRAGQFREDLLYRLNTIELALPPLRERREDIPALTNHILSKIAKNRAVSTWTLTQTAASTLRDFDWPGNIRQLENILERVTAFSEDPSIQAEDIVTLLESPSPTSKHQIFAEPGLTLHEIEREAFIRSYIRTGKNKAKTARELGISERSVYNLMARHGLR